MIPGTACDFIFIFLINLEIVHFFWILEEEKNFGIYYLKFTGLCKTFDRLRNMCITYLC